MGLFGKIKNILFDEEETYDEPVETVKQVKEVKEIKEVEKPKPKDEEPYIPTFRRNFEPELEVEKKQPVVKPVKKEESPFVSFDEDEFEKVKVKTTRTSSNISIETKPDGGRKINYNKYEIKQETEKKPFKPSPVISPVYGILDKNYVKEDLMPKRKEIRTNSEVNVDTVRNKAYGTLEDEINDNLGVKIDYYDEVDTDKTIDELLQDTIEENVEIVEESEPIVTYSVEDELENEDFNDDFVEEPEPIEVEDVVDDLEQTSALEILDEIEKELDTIKDKKTPASTESLENDLFELIDSMYEQRKDGEK